MIDAPPLPESDDPFEVLGVPRDADELSVRRAYVRLIKLYRPDRNPEAFAQVRRAYEGARQAIQWRAYEYDGAVDDDPDDYDGDEDADEDNADENNADEDHADEDALSETGASWQAVPKLDRRPDAGDTRGSVSRSISSAWRALAGGEDVRTLLLRLREPFDDERVAMHRTLLSDAGGIGYRDEVLASLRAGRPVVGWLLDVLKSKEVHQLVAEDDFAWGTLRRQEKRPEAAHLMRTRLHVHMVRGRLDRAVAEVLDEEYVGDAELDHVLTWAGQEVLAVAAWAAVPEVDQLDRRYGASAAEDFEFLSPQDHRAAAEGLREPWLVWRREFKSFKALRRFLVLAPIVSGQLLGELSDDLASDYLHRSGVYAAGFFRMHAKAPELLERFILAADSLCAFEPDEADLRVLERRPLRRLERDLDAGLRGTGHAAYVDVVRPALTRAVVEQDVSPRLLADALLRDPKTLPWLAKHVHSVLEERMLAALHACGRLAGAASA